MGQTNTVLLGQFTEDNAEKICQALEDAGITWWVKQASGLSQLLFAGEWGVRIFIDTERQDDAAAIARTITES